MNKYPRIKTDELPEGYFVSTIAYPSGNTTFVSKESTSEVVCDYCIGFPTIYTKTGKQINDDNNNEVPCYFNPKEIYGTKHIQLIAVNPKIHLYRYEVDFSFGTEQREEYGFFNISELGYEDDRYNDKDAFWLDNEVISEQIVEKELKRLSKKQYELSVRAKQQGKDFFIYKATDIKGDKHE